MPKLTFQFDGISFKQNPTAPELFGFVAPAEELIRFCGVARKSERMLTNYQRALDIDRVKREVTPFFRQPENCSPTAIVLSIHDFATTSIKFADLDLSGTSSIKRMMIEMEDVDAMSDDEVIEASIKFLNSRLDANKSQDPSEGEEEEEEEVSDEDTESGTDELTDDVETYDDDTAQNTTDDDIELGSSMLRTIRDKLVNRDDINKDFIDALRDNLKPALIIDGQHRLFGAAAVEENIPFLACALIRPDWKEQVFQFTVINDKAVGIPKPFITSLAGMSLTSSELREMTVRLQQAGVQLWEVEVMQHLGYDVRSAFFQRIEFKISGAAGANTDLGYQTMKRVGKLGTIPKPTD